MIVVEVHSLSVTSVVVVVTTTVTEVYAADERHIQCASVRRTTKSFW